MATCHDPSLHKRLSATPLRYLLRGKIRQIVLQQAHLVSGLTQTQPLPPVATVATDQARQHLCQPAGGHLWCMRRLLRLQQGGQHRHVGWYLLLQVSILSGGHRLYCAQSWQAETHHGQQFVLGQALRPDKQRQLTRLRI